MFVSEQRVLSVSIGAARVRLANLVHDGWLAGAAEAAYGGSIDHLLRVGPFGDVACLSRKVRVQFLDPVDHGDAVTVGMRWAAVGMTGGLFPVLDADIELAAEGEEDTRVTLTGVYRPPLGAVGVGLDRMLLHRVATATIGSLLAHLAQALATAAPAAAEAGTPVWWETGPEAAS
jgi:acyl-coenzyme A thioesterase PaaI-like protein